MPTLTTAEQSSTEEEERILRLWTPVLLRTILIVSMVLLIVGVILSATFAPDYFVKRYREVQLGHLLGRAKLSHLVTAVRNGEPHSVTMVGLFALTLVPLARVAFCFLLFIRQRDYIYVIFTAYVLVGLIFGMLLGHAG